MKVLDRSIEFDQLSPPTVTGTHSALETFTQDPILLHDLIVALGLSRQRTVLMFRKPPSPTDDGLIDTQGKVFWEGNPARVVNRRKAAAALRKLIEEKLKAVQTAGKAAARLKSNR